ncbi:MAG: Gfo/Idh/MocA family oxidoreductase, partial [Lentisphaeria bacterium]|nr:Gfo/Idh/MocA family oxidoreductase [Lentisphaeria bacterium]
MKKQVNVGFIGAGSFVSGYHLLTARDSELMKIRAIADISKETLELQQKKFKPDYVTTDYKEVLADPEIDMV